MARRRNYAGPLSEGFSLSQARGHPRPGERSIREVRAAAQSTGRSVGQVLDTDRFFGPRAAKSSRVVEGGRSDAGAIGRILDTRSKRDAMRFLRSAARNDLWVQIIGTRSDGMGVPLYGAGTGTTAGNQPRPQHAGPASGGSQGVGTYGRVRAAAFLRLVNDTYDGDLWEAIDGEGDDNYASSGAPVVAVHFFAA